jgi:hypothetical protein
MSGSGRYQKDREPEAKEAAPMHMLVHFVVFAVFALTFGAVWLGTGGLLQPERCTCPCHRLWMVACRCDCD